MLEAGFDDPVRDAQRCFRAVLDAMAHPGRIVRVSGATASLPLGAAAAAVVLTLVDHDTPIWLDPDAERARRWIEFHCGAPVTTNSGACRFAMALALPDLARFAAGTHEEPETSATIVCEVDSFDTGPVFRLSGSGIRSTERLTVSGLPQDFATIWRRNRALFPRGIDLILCAGERLAALPRTVSVEEI
jgi:alpha-D-ribose 1-methylphosphonate 5-triphosphate synthase subunit PhnH